VKNNRILFSAFAFQICLLVSQGWTAERTDSQKISQGATGALPVQRVVLYKNGVGYFEHIAHVRGTQDLSIDFTSAQLNDVLKSLTAVDMGEGHISSVRYNSIAPLEERLKSLRLPFGTQVSRAEFLQAARGARVEVRSGARTASGRLLTVETRRTQDSHGNFIDSTEFAIITDAGEMKTFELAAGISVRIADRDLTEEVGRYLGLIGSSRARDVRRMTLTASGTGGRDVFVAYISEVPIWKSTYRIIFPDKSGEKPLLQGWAIVDNTIGEDWKEVRLSLVAGAPQSFVQDVSQPYYARRPVVPLPESAMLTPQSHEATQFDRLQQLAPLSPGVVGGGTANGALAGLNTGLQGVVKDPSGAPVSGAQVSVRNEETGQSQITRTDPTGRYSFSSIQAGNSAVFVHSPGFHRYEVSNVYLGVGRVNEIDASLNLGSASETVEVQAAPIAVNTDSASLATIAGQQKSEAESKSAGDFFQYDIKQAITIARNQSALVPILQAHIEAEKVTVWNENSAPLHAIWIKNTSGQVLDSGTFNVLEANTFAGEGVLENIHPNERRLLSYAADTAVHVKYEVETSERPFNRVKIAKGVMVLTKQQWSKKNYSIRNSDSSPRQVIVEYPAEQGWQLSKSSPGPDESSASFHRFRVKVDPEKTAELTIEAAHPEETSYELTDLDPEQVELLVKQQRTTPALESAFRRILGQKDKVNNFDGRIKQLSLQSTLISNDQTRIRENMKALKGSSEERELLQRYARQLNSQEDQLEAIRKEVSSLQVLREKEHAELSSMILDLNLDERF
jgi:hypothetical protein